MLICVTSSEPSRAAAFSAIFKHICLGGRTYKTIVIELNFFVPSIKYKKLERNGVSLFILTIPKVFAKLFSLFLLRSGVFSFLQFNVFLPTSSWSRFTGSRVRKNYFFYGDGFGYANSLKKPSWLSHDKPKLRRHEEIYFIKSIKSHKEELLSNDCRLVELDFFKSISIFKEILHSEKQEMLYEKISNQIDVNRNFLLFCGTTFASSGRMTAENEVALYERKIIRICTESNIPAVNVFVLLHPGNLAVNTLACSSLHSYTIINGDDPIYCETLLDFLVNEREIAQEQCIVCPGSLGPLMGSLEYVKPENIIIPFSERLLMEHLFNLKFIKSRLKQESDMKAQLTNCQ